MAPDLANPYVGLEVPLAADAESPAFSSTVVAPALPVLADEREDVCEGLAVLGTVMQPHCDGRGDHLQAVGEDAAPANWALREELVEKNPAANMDLPTVARNPIGPPPPNLADALCTIPMPECGVIERLDCHIRDGPTWHPRGSPSSGRRPRHHGGS